MPEKFQNKYRIPSARATWWDYGSNAPYFVTICTSRSIHYFGKVIDGTMRLSAIGLIAQQCWNEIPLHFPFVILDEFVVMPNHIHGIIIINKPNIYMQSAGNVKTQNFASPNSSNGTQDFASSASNETQDFASLPAENHTKNKFGPQSKNLASIIRGFKIGVTKSARLSNPDFAWQPRYHDRIIRDEKAYENIANYIRNNPKNWKKDKFHQ
ncbi:transposase [Pedobacter xixiisoli]|uniref:Transposase IS200-like domain-containing protein n=1 Tax=Pedobacter xixiisoli TaxID=1476464 RepID=A0A286ACN4_9SPHI|nr:transposase [Pedobacter xixiisoli]SOD19653.1 hypothetical protein SAMN06297358_3358 [Pedobacter xixiisoli]